MEFRDGIININKPAGWTSQDVCAKLRRRLHIKKIGHTGTLDPMATGVLPVCIGKATRIIEYYDWDIKTYHSVMQLGMTTDTLDTTGEVISQADYGSVTEEAISKAFESYKGIIAQIPPKYSALKINGKRAYDLAREGKDFEIRPREIFIYSNRITGTDLTNGYIGFDVSCSKGTYIRTICDDIGRELGCGAAMAALVRTGTGCFRIEDAADITELVEMTDEEVASHIIPMEKTLTNLGEIQLYDNRVIAFLNGNTSDIGFRVTKEPSYLSDSAPDKAFYQAKGASGTGPYYKVFSKGRFLGIGTTDHGTLIPHKVIAER